MKPIRTLRDGAIFASIWENTREEGSFLNVSFGRTYTDAAGNPQNAESFGGLDLLRVARLAAQAYDVIVELKD